MTTATLRSSTRLRGLALELTLLFLVSCGYDRPTEPRPGGKLDVGSTSLGFLHDNFTGANGTLLENHIPDGEGDPFRWIRSDGDYVFYRGAESSAQMYAFHD